MINTSIESRVDKMNLFSELLGKEMKINIYVPAGYSEQTPLPVLYFLHGRSGDHNILFDIRMNKEMDTLLALKQVRPFLIVCPQINNSHGLDSSKQYKELPDPTDPNRMLHFGMYMSYLLTEVVPQIDANYNTIKNREGRYIGGVSGGGYAALHSALRHQHLFSKIGGHMPALELQPEEDDKLYYPTMQDFFENDPIHIANSARIKDLDVYLDCGNEDEAEFYKGCALLHSVLCKKGVKSQNHLFNGRHNLEYVASNVKNYLMFYGQ